MTRLSKILRAGLAERWILLSSLTFAVGLWA